MQKGSLVKRKHSPQKDAANSSSSASSSNDEDTAKDRRQRNRNKHSLKGKKPRERNSPPTSDNEDKTVIDQSDNGRRARSASTKIVGDNTKPGVGSLGTKEANQSTLKGKEHPEPSSAREQEENLMNTEKSDKQLVNSIEQKMNISSGTKDKAKKNAYLFDFLGDEVSTDESQALQALSSFWVNSVARNKDIMKRSPPKDKDEEDFYNKYCDKHGSLSIIAATRLMSLPHVITVCLKNTAQIEVVVSDRHKALEASEELRLDHFDVVEAMAMHLM